MTLIYRIKRLIKADAHALVDGLEEPKWILNQAIRDMEAALEKKRSCIEQKINQNEQLLKKIENINLHFNKNENDIDLAIDERREDIAKHLIKKNIIFKKNMSIISDQKEQLSSELDRLEEDLKVKEKAYDEITARAEHVVFEKNEPDVFGETKAILDKEISLDHEVEIEFLRRVKKAGKVSHENK
jgi:phage shock protein A